MCENPYRTPSGLSKPSAQSESPRRFLSAIGVHCVGLLLVIAGVILLSLTTVRVRSFFIAWSLFLSGGVSILAGVWVIGLVEPEE